MTLDPVSVEITYGIERIMMALQGVTHFKDIAYAPGISLRRGVRPGRVRDEPVLPRRRRRRPPTSACSSSTRPRPRRMIDARLPVPAHIYVLKCSHTFNVLDARGAVSARRNAPRRSAGCATPGPRGRASCGPSAARSSATRSGDRRTPPPAAPVPTEFPPAAGPGTLTLRDRHRGAAAVRGHHDRARPCETALDREAGRDPARPRRRHDVRDAAPGGRVRRRASQPGEPDAERVVRGPRKSAAYDADGNADQGRRRVRPRPGCRRRRAARVWTSTASSTSR